MTFQVFVLPIPAIGIYNFRPLFRYRTILLKIISRLQYA